MIAKFTRAELKLLDAIHANSREDGPRLAYADWLEHHGQAEYANFIRLQCEHARQHSEKHLAVPESPTEAELRRRFGQVWAAPFLKVQAQSGFERGMPAFQIPRPGTKGTLRAKVAQAFRYGSPRHYLTLLLAVEDIDPLASVADHPLMKRVHSIIVKGWEFSGEASRPPSVTLPLVRIIAEAPFFCRLDWIVVQDGSVELERELAGVWSRSGLTDSGKRKLEARPNFHLVFSWV
jgi:uncharacterized protein (TIGR02996 family)